MFYLVWKVKASSCAGPEILAEQDLNCNFHIWLTTSVCTWEEIQDRNGQVHELGFMCLNYSEKSEVC